MGNFTNVFPLEIRNGCSDTRHEKTEKHLQKISSFPVYLDEYYKHG
jgi:hypothetical protein